jgi:WD40-like Beta Propeller Repeat
MCTARARSSAAALLLLLAPGLVSAATRYDPRLRFRTYRTEHFDVHAHQGEEALARRLAAMAERVRARFQPSLGVPRGRVQVILVDQTDFSGGWATPFPYNAIEITAAPPSGQEEIGNTTDWLELVFTHEYTHVLHLDRSRGFMGGVRRIFGRAPLVFPNLFLPVWQIEGFATYEESHMTGQGRIPAGDFRALVDVPARQRRFEPIDRAGGGLDDWPDGHAAYAYGAYFHQYLADRFGAARVEALADATADRLPLLGAGAFKATLGASVSSLWRDFQEARKRSTVGSTSATDAAARRLTRDGFVVAAPRVGPDGAVYYRTSNADGFPALMRLEGGVARRLAWRVHGMRTAVGAGWVVFDQLELVRSVAIRSDLYAVPREGGSVVRLTNDARAGHPDLSPDGRRIACVVYAPGRRALAVMDFEPRGPRATPRLLVDDADADYTGPRWSPDGSRIVAERRRGGRYELVLVDPATGGVQLLLARADARLVTPSWTADGSTVLFAANVESAPFNVYAVDVRSGDVRQVTDSVSGAQSPEIAPDGSLIYVGYTPAGYDLFSLPAGFRLNAPPNPSVPAGSLGSSRLQAGDSMAVDEKLVTYRPFRTLVPTYWEPVIATDAGETLVGAATGMSDVLGRHAYNASAAWAGSRARPDWTVAYAYDRWRPTIFASYTDDTDPITGGDLRSREIFAGALLPFRRIRRSQTLMAGFDAETQTVTCTAACRVETPRRDLRSIRGGWAYDSRRLFPYSISVEEGFTVDAAIEASRRALGSDGDATAAIFDARAFQRLGGTHAVLALRLAAAGGWGDTRARRLFSASGPGGSDPSFDFGRDTIGLLRGFDPEDIVGPRAAVLNADLRVPLLRVQRGPGLWPIFIRSIHAAAFVDAGNAWGRTFRVADIRYAAGGELATDVVLIHYLPITIAGGASWFRDPVAGRDGAAFFARVGYAF